MKIIQLARMYSPHLGGVEIHLKEMNSLLIKQGHEVIVITTQHDRKLSLDVECDGVRVLRIPNEYIGDKKKTWNYISSLSKLLQSTDVIHVHDVFWWIFPVYLKNKKKIFTTFHGWETEYPVALNAKIQRYLYSKMSVGAIHVGAWIQKYYFDTPNFVIYGGINPKRFTKSRKDKTRKKINNKTIDLVFIGRLEKENEIEKYILLINELKHSGLKVNMTWVGDGSYINDCKKVGVVTGFVKNVSKYLASADIVFASSYLSILESQLLAKNVCAFYSNDLKKDYLETYPGSSYMLISNSVDGMIKKIKLLVGNKRSFDKTAKQAENFAKEMTWDKVLKVYLKLWKQQ